MSLDKVQISVPYANGIDQKATTQLLPPGSQAEVTNGLFVKNGSIRKRYGTRAIGSLNTPIHKLFTYKDELCAVVENDGGGSNNLGLCDVVSYSPGGSAFTGNKPTYVPNVLGTRRGLYSAPAGASSYDICENSSYTAIVYTADVSGTGTEYPLAQIFDTTTGAPITSVITLESAAAFSVKVFQVGSTFVATWKRGALIRASTASATAPSLSPWSAAASIVTNASNLIGSGIYDARATENSSTRFVVAYENNIGIGSPLTVKQFSATLVQQSTIDVASADSQFLGIGVTDYSGERAWVAYGVASASDTLVRVVGINWSGPAVSVALTTAYTMTNTNAAYDRISLVRLSSTDVLVVSSGPPNVGNFLPATWWIRWTSSATAAFGLRQIYSTFLVSRPVYYNNRAYCTVCFYGYSNINTTQDSLYLVELLTSTDGIMMGAIAPTACTLVTNASMNASVVSMSASTAGKYRTLATINASGTKHRTLSLVTFDFNAPIWQTAELGESTYITAGSPYFYDGLVTAEVGFPWFPEGCTATDSGVAGALSGIYQYVLVYEWYDSKGQWHQSAPSVPFSTPNLVSKKVNLKLPTLCLTQKANVGLAIYRTIAGGSVFYRLTPSDTPSGLYNTKSTWTIAYQDNLPDTGTISLQDGTHPILAYVNGNEQANSLPPSSSTCLIHNGRIWLAGGDNPKNVWFSKLLVDGDAPGFSAAFIVPFDEEIVAMASMDGQLICFSKSNIWVIRGPGPDNAGGSDRFSDPEKITSNVGCIDQRSVVRVQDGLLFQSTGGIYLLTRSYEVIYHGHNVEDTVASYNTITSAVLMDAQGQQRFSVNNGSTGKVLVYDDIQKAWSIASYQNTGGVADQLVISAVKWGNNGYVFAAGSTVYIEDKTLNTDSGNWVPMTVTTAWMRGDFIAAYYRFWWLILTCEQASAHDLTVSVGYDYENTFPQTYSYTNTNLSTFIVGTREQVAIKPFRQKCESIRLKVVDAFPTGGSLGTGAGPYLIGMDMIMGIKRGGNKLPSAAKA